VVYTGLLKEETLMLLRNYLIMVPILMLKILLGDLHFIWQFKIKIIKLFKYV